MKMMYMESRPWRTYRELYITKQSLKKREFTELPKTPDEFLEDLQKIKDNTDAIPLYTNFAADWTMNAWDAIY